MFLKRRKLPESLNICLVAHKFPILSRSSDGGFLWPIARGLAKQGHTVTIISTRSPLGKPEVERDGVHAHYLLEGVRSPQRINFQNAALKKFEQLHKAKPFHIVHSMDKSGYKIAKNKKRYDVAVCYDVEATQMSQLFSIIGMQQETLQSLILTGVALFYKFISTYYGGDRQLLRTADGIYISNPLQKSMLERYYLYPEYHTFSVPYAAEVGDLNPKEKSIELRNKLNIPELSHIAVTISDMTNVDELIPLLIAFEKTVIKKPNSYLILIGNGPKWKEIEYEILNRALGNHILMVGAVPAAEIEDHILLGDVFISLSSRSTGFEPSLIEAMAQKKVVIGSEVSPISNIIEDGIDGFLIRPADSDSLCHILIETFSKKIPADEIGEKARQKVVDLFDTKKMIQSTIDSYKKILVRAGQYTV